ncbi:MAG: hypothetical protein KA436_12610 [Oligoflexales bacterium]|nr:hypothetical protein [Oligoflexales bacterium]
MKKFAFIMTLCVFYSSLSLAEAQRKLLSGSLLALVTQFSKVASEDDFGYQYALLEKDRNPVFLLGESHIKNLMEKKNGRDLISSFRLVGHEEVPKKEMEILLQKVDPHEASFIHAYKTVLTKFQWCFVLLFGICSSSINDVLSLSQTVVDPNDGQYQETLKLTLKSFNPTRDRVAIGLEGFYSIENVRDSDGYILHDRDQRMAKSIDFILAQLTDKNKTPLLVIVGKDHLQGMIHELRYTLGFKILVDNIQKVEVSDANKPTATDSGIAKNLMFYVLPCLVSLRFSYLLVHRRPLTRPVSFAVGFLAYRLSMETISAVYYTARSLYSSERSIEDVQNPVEL